MLISFLPVNEGKDLSGYKRSSVNSPIPIGYAENHVKNTLNIPLQHQTQCYYNINRDVHERTEYSIIWCVLILKIIDHYSLMVLS